MGKIFKQSSLVAVVTSALDFTFHVFLTHPMETLTYFVIKFLLAFFVAAGLFSLSKFIESTGRRKRITYIIIAGLIFSTLMSAYYRAWELGEAGVPFGSRAPDIIGITRYTILFSAVWWLGHASFFAIGAWLAATMKNAAGQFNK